MKSCSSARLALGLTQQSKIIIAVCLISVLTPIPFVPSLSNGFVNWDDGKYITENSWIKDLSLENVREMFTQTFTTGEYVPLSHLSYALDYAISGLKPHMYHRSNLILHVLNTLLVFWLVILLGGDVYASFVCAILFGIHPLRVESVAWASERKDVLYTLFFIMSVISYLYYKSAWAKACNYRVAEAFRFRERRKRHFYFLSIFLFILSLLSKQTAIILPVTLILCDYLRGGKIDRGCLLEKIPYFVLSVALGVFLIHPSTINVTIYHGPRFAGRLLAVLTSPAFYLEKTVIPFRLSALYPFPSETGILHPNFFLPVILIVYLCFLALYFLKYTKKLIFGTLFFISGILPMLIGLPFSGVVFAADRYTYLASIGLFYVAGEGFSWLYARKPGSKRIKRFLLISLTAIVAVLSTLTWQRCKIWGSGITLWQDVLRNYPDVPQAHNNLASAYIRFGHIEKAMWHCEKAIELWPGAPLPYANLGAAYMRLEKPEKAIPHLMKSLQLDPNSAEVYRNLGIAYSNMGDTKKVMACYKKVLELRPDYAEAFNDLGRYYLHFGEPQKAIKYFEQALELKPDFREARKNLESAYSEAKKKRK